MKSFVDYFTCNCSISACGNLITESGKASGVNDKSRQGCDHSPSVDSDNPSTDVDSGQESDTAQSSPVSARPKKITKKKQRTTFSPLEVLELEKVFAQRPYLMPEDEDELVQKLGITPRNVRVRIFFYIQRFCFRSFKNQKKKKKKKNVLLRKSSMHSLGIASIPRFLCSKFVALYVLNYYNSLLP